MKAKKGKFAGKVTIKATPGSYYVLACVGKACIAKAIKVTTKAAPAPPQPAPTAPVSAPISRPAPGNENLPPAPTVTPTPGPGNPDPTPIPVPADPKDAAPELDPGAATSVYDATKFLYCGANPIQRDVEPGAIERQAGRRAARHRPGPRRASRSRACA